MAELNAVTFRIEKVVDEEGAEGLALKISLEGDGATFDSVPVLALQGDILALAALSMSTAFHRAANGATRDLTEEELEKMVAAREARESTSY